MSIRLNEVVDMYKDYCEGRSSKDSFWRRSCPVSYADNVFFSGDRPIAVYLGERHGRPFYMKNGDRDRQFGWGNSAFNGHNQMIQWGTPGFTTSFETLRAARITPQSLTMKNLIDVLDDTTIHGYLHKETRKFYKTGKDAFLGNDNYEDFKVGSFQEDRWWARGKAHKRIFTIYDGDKGVSKDDIAYKDMPFFYGVWHILGGALLEWNGNHYISALDEWQYFCAQLPKRVKNVHYAFESLKPEPVKQALKEGRVVKRQGEWFFVPVSDDEMPSFKKKDIKHSVELPYKREGRNVHVVSQLIKLNNITYVTGRVRHVNTWNNRGTGEHVMVTLVGWHKLYKNREVESWVAPEGLGRFD